jgi:tetratricopeptide (TPR) repeat protein
MVQELSSADREIPTIRGAVKYTLGNQQGAIVDFDRAIELNPKSAPTYYNRGFAKYRLGNKQGAIVDIILVRRLIYLIHKDR